LGTPLHANGYQRKTSQSIDSNHSKIQIQIWESVHRNEWERTQNVND
jgi:hypothetical protein